MDTEDSGAPAARISLDRVYELLQENIALSRETQQDVKYLKERQADNDSRLRSLEAFRSQVKGVSAVVMAVFVPVLVAVTAKLFGV